MPVNLVQHRREIARFILYEFNLYLNIELKSIAWDFANVKSLLDFIFGISAGIYLFKFNNKNTRIRCEIRSKLTVKTPERRRWRRSDVFFVNFKHISHLILVSLLLTLNR